LTMHLLAKDGHYCCSVTAKIKDENSTIEQKKVTCQNCIRVFQAYWSNVFYRVAYDSSRGIKCVLPLPLEADP
jgi:hypothetical protein